MNKIGVVADSHSSITQEEGARLGIRVLATPFYIEGECYYEGVTLPRELFYEKLRAGVPVTTSQPSPEEVTDIWDEALKEYDQILYFPISSALSGACQMAEAFSQNEEYAGKVFVVDNGQLSTPMHRAVLDALELIEEGYPAEQIKEILEGIKDKTVIYIGLENLESVKRGGRVSAAAAVIATALNIRPVLKFCNGDIEIFRKCHGFKNAKKVMIEAIRHDMETAFKEWNDRGEITLMAACSTTPEEASEWVREIEEAFPGMHVMYDDLSFGVSSHVGYGGLGIGCSCRPVRPEKKK